MNQYLNKQKGMTLLEVLIALGLFAAIYVTFMSSMTTNYQHMKKASVKSNMATLLEKKMIEIEAQYKHRPTSLPEEDSGEFEGFPQYKWTLKTQDMEFPDLSGILFANQDSVDESMQMVVNQMKDFFSKAVKEVALTIKYQKKGMKKPFEVQLTTLFIDYNQQVGLGGGGQ